MQLSPRENTLGLGLTQAALSVCAQPKAHAYVCANIEDILLRVYCWDDGSLDTYEYIGLFNGAKMHRTM